MLYVGVDPDLHDLAVAGWRDGQPAFARVLSLQKSIKGEQAVLAMIRAIVMQGRELLGGSEPFALAVENQQFKARHARPIDIVRLGHVAAAAVAIGALYTEHVAFPTPEDWKGSVEKSAMQARLYHDLGWGYEIRADYAVPQTVPQRFKAVSNAQWKHVGDALLLAKWCSQQSLAAAR